MLADGLLEEVPHVAAISEATARGFELSANLCLEGSFRRRFEGVLVLLAEAFENPDQFGGGVVLEIQVDREPRLQSGIAVDEGFHVRRVAGGDHDQAIAMVFHALDQGVDGLAAEVILAAGDKGVGFIHEEHSIQGLAHQIVGFLGGVADVLADQAEAIGLDAEHALLPADLQPEEFDRSFDWDTRRDDFIRYAQRRALGPSTASIVHAAEKRGIPWIRLNEQSLIQLGYGCNQQRIQATITGRTSHIAVELASDKEETNKILANLGLPVPRQRLVQTVDMAVDAARRIGYPVVLKPYNGNHGRGVSINLMTAAEVREAFTCAQEHSRSVIVETFITGHDHRMVVINGELVAVSKREPGHVIGDGTHSIQELVAIVNSDPRRGVGHEKVLTRIELDAQANGLLQKLGYTAASVPPLDEIVYLRLTANLSTGGTARDMTDLVHPDNAEMAVRAIKAIGLDVGGDGDRTMMLIYDLPRVVHWFTGNIAYHHIHHLASRIPNYRLREAYESSPVLQEAPRLTFWSSLRCAQLKLWDEDLQQLVGFPRRARA